MLTIEWIHDLAVFAALGEEWATILPGSSRPFDLHCWHLAWWRAFGAGRELALCTARRDGRLVGVFPLLWEKGRLTAMFNGHSGVYRPLAADPEALRAMVDEAMRQQPRELVLSAIPTADPSLETISTAARDASMRLFSEPGYVSPIVDTSGDRDAWSKGAAASWKARLARYRRKMLRDFDAELEIAAAPGDREALLREGFAVEASGWKGEAGTAISSRPETVAFYQEIGRAFDDRDELRLSRIALDGRAVAFSFCIFHGGRLYQLKTGYDESMRKIVPGLVLQLSIVERCFETEVEAFELLGTRSEWKDKLATEGRPHRNLRVFPSGPSGAARHAYRRRLRPALRRAYRRLSGGDR